MTAMGDQSSKNKAVVAPLKREYKIRS